MDKKNKTLLEVIEHILSVSVGKRDDFELAPKVWLSFFRVCLLLQYLLQSCENKKISLILTTQRNTLSTNISTVPNVTVVHVCVPFIDCRACVYSCIGASAKGLSTLKILFCSCKFPLTV